MPDRTHKLAFLMGINMGRNSNSLRALVASYQDFFKIKKKKQTVKKNIKSKK